MRSKPFDIQISLTSAATQLFVLKVQENWTRPRRNDEQLRECGLRCSAIQDAAAKVHLKKQLWIPHGIALRKGGASGLLAKARPKIAASTIRLNAMDDFATYAIVLETGTSLDAFR